MDSRFLEFYGNMLLNAAKGQRQFEQFEQFSKIMAPGFKLPDFKGFEGFEELFKQYYGFAGSPSAAAPEDKQFKKMLSAFQSSFSTYAKQMGWVPLQEHEALKEKNEDLEQKVRDQQEVIDGFNRLLGLGDQQGYTELLSQMQQINKQQNDQIKATIQTFFKAFDPSGTSTKT